MNIHKHARLTPRGREIPKELLQLCGALLPQHANPCQRLSRFVVYAIRPDGARQLMLDTGDETRAPAEHRRLETRCPGSAPCIFRREYVQLDSTAILTAAARLGQQTQQDAETTTSLHKETA